MSSLAIIGCLLIANRSGRPTISIDSIQHCRTDRLDLIGNSVTDPLKSSGMRQADIFSNFPNPSRDERRQYAIYWQKKLSSNHEIDFPDSLLDEVADQTDKFFFAYLKEAL